jgi:hypothetical protein
MNHTSLQFHCRPSSSTYRALGVSVALLFAASAAHAEDNGGVKTQFLERDTAYIFKDDPLEGGTLSDASTRIRVRPQGSRAALVRPRVHFVREIFKSAESL